VKTLRGYDRTTGAPIGTINLGPAGATLLADVAVGPDGSLYVTDAAVTYSARGVPQRTGRDAIFRIVGRTSSVAIETPRLASPMGIAWDRTRDRFLIASSGSDTLFSWRPGSSTLEVAGHGTGQWEGVVATTTGGYLATSRASQAVFRFENSTYGTRLLELSRAGGDLALDPRRGRLVIALPSEGRIEVWQAPR
jgi:hypothetical protein